MILPTSVGSFIILIANEAHESWQDEKHKLITDRNPYYIPKSLVIPQGTTITCPGKYWPDNKTGNHTLIIFATEQPLSDALIKLKKMVRDNVYI